MTHYDEQESYAEAAANAQIEHDQAALEADLYAIGMDSERAYRLMPLICKAMGVAYPPKQGVPA